MEFLLDFLPIIIYILLIILIILGIWFFIKAIIVANKIDGLIEDFELKLNSLNSLFKAINWTTDKINLIGEKIIDGVLKAVHKLFNRRKDDDYE